MLRSTRWVLSLRSAVILVVLAVLLAPPPQARAQVVTSADLSVTLSDSPDPVVSGSNITYTISLANNGPDPADTVNVTMAVPANTTFVSATPNGVGWSTSAPAVGATGNIVFSKPTVAVGSETFTVVVNVNPTTLNGSTISATSTVASNTPDPDGSGPSDTETTGVIAPDLTISKTGPAIVTAGATTANYTVTVTNAGGASATNVTLTDSIPSGATFHLFDTSTFDIGGSGPSGPIFALKSTLAAGASAQVVYSLDVDASVANGTALTNNASVTTTSNEPDTGNNGTSFTSLVTTSANLSVTKTDSPDPVTPGTDITYTITVNNAGPSNASSVSLSDTLPPGTTLPSLTSPGGWSCTFSAPGPGRTVTCTIASLAPGSAVFTLTVRSDPAGAAGGTFTNSATVSSVTGDGTPGNETGSATTTYGTPSANLLVAKGDSPDPVTPGNNINYPIQVTNIGPSNAANVSLSDTLPAGTTFVSLSSPPGWTCSTPVVGAGGTITCTNPSLELGSTGFTLTAKVDPAVAPATVISNSATATSTTGDPTPGNETGTSTTTVGPRSANLAVTKVDTPDPVIAGNNLTYTVTVNNSGPSNAATVTLTDPLPPGTTFVSLSSAGGWSCTTPAVGGTGTITCTNPSLGLGNAVFTLVVKVDAGVPLGSAITNTATVTSPTNDPTPGNESGQSTTGSGTGVDLVASKTASPNSVTPGRTVTFTLGVTNNGPSIATGVRLVDALPEGLTFVPGASSPECTAAGQVITCQVGSLAVGASITSKVVASVTAEVGVTNAVVVSADQAELNPANNTAVLVLANTPNPDRIFEFTTSTVTVDASAGTVTITVRNPTGLPGTVQFTTRDGTARANVDYVPISGTLTFAAGETSKTITIRLIPHLADLAPLPEDTLADGGPGVLLDGAPAVILYAIALDATDLQQTTPGPVSFSVVLSNPSAGSALGQNSVITINVQQQGNTAAGPQDDTDPSRKNTRENKDVKETEEERQQRERTNQSGRSDVAIEGNVLAVEKAADGKSQLVTLGLTRGETQVVQVPCYADGNCHDIRVGDYLEADGDQNGVRDENTYFVATEDVEITRNGKRVK